MVGGGINQVRRKKKEEEGGGRREGRMGKEEGERVCMAIDRR